MLADKGFGGLTLRAVAAAMNGSTGMLMHYFPTKRALIAHALDLLEVRTAERLRRARPAEGLPSVRAILLDILPLTPDDTARNRIWVSSWDLALADEGLAGEQAGRYARLRGTVRPHLEAAGRAAPVGRCECRRRTTGGCGSRVHARAGRAGTLRPRPVPCRRTDRDARRLPGLARAVASAFARCAHPGLIARPTSATADRVIFSMLDEFDRVDFRDRLTGAGGGPVHFLGFWSLVAERRLPPISMIRPAALNVRLSATLSGTCWPTPRCPMM